MAVHDLPLGRPTLHGHFSRELAPVVCVDSGDTVRFATLHGDWGFEPPDFDEDAERETFVPREPGLDDGHALCGPIAVRGARAGATLAVRIDRIRIGPQGWTCAYVPLEEWQKADAYRQVLVWALDADAGRGRDQFGRVVSLEPFLGVIGMPPPEPGRHSTIPPRRFGGNIDCRELTAGSTLYLPIPVDGALLSAGDAHARQGDGEICGTAIECPCDLVELTISVRDDLALDTPIARTNGAWVTFGFDEDVDVAAAQAVAAMLDLMQREHDLDRADARALASVAVDLRITQVVNGVCGVHALLSDDAIVFDGVVAA